MDIPSEVLKCVAFIGIGIPNEGQIVYYPGGTGFFVSVDSEIHPNVTYIYFVTAKHVIEGVGDRDSCIRVNGKSGEALMMHIPKTTKWFYHPDDQNVDVAVAQVYNEMFDIKTVPTSMFISHNELPAKNIGIGDDVFITGLFVNLPIVRVGNIAMLPDEKIWVGWHSGCEIDAYLIEARSIGGISGSPVFFNRASLKGGGLRLGRPEFYLGGLIHGHWPTNEDEIDSLVGDNMENNKEKNINMGIAIVVPAEKILEVINQGELGEMRRKEDQEIQKTKASTAISTQNP